jgi:uncharacterized membrane protein YdjX (TVP38/TMEM64 family)
VRVAPQVDESADQSRKKGLLKISILIAFVLFSIYLVRHTSLKETLTAENVSRSLEHAGRWAPLFFVLLYAAGVCLFIPGTLLTGFGAALFGPFHGFLYVWVGAMLGASVAFLIGRTLGRDFASSLIGERLKRYDEAIRRNGFGTVLYLRLVYFPFTPMNFGMGLTAVRFKDYFLGTALGILVGTFVFTFLVGTLKEVWASGEWGRLISLRVFFSLFLFILSLFIPRIIKRFRRGDA